MSDVPTRLLRETLRDGLSAPASGCLEADTLAGWADGTLGAGARAAAETHASSCARCQALLAAMVRTAPPAEARRFWSLWSLAWLTPVAAATAAVLLWINAPRSPLEPRAAPVPAAVPTPEAYAAVASDRPLPPAASPSSRSGQRASAKVDQRKDALQRLAQAAASPEARDNDAKVAAQPTSPAADAAGERAPAASRFRAEALQMSVAAAEVATPDGSVRWRILAAGGVARSSDRGLTWQPQVTGVATPLTAGAAPATTTCWLVGRGGVVLLSTDGRTWQRLQFPEAIDLTAVTATDATHATVTAADDRRFTTADGGKTWR